MFPSNNVNFREFEDFLPHFRGKKYPNIDYSIGGIAINDPSMGLEYQRWRARIDGTDILLGSEITGKNYVDEFVLFQGLNFTNITLAFDNNMMPSVCVEILDKKQILLHWFDSTVNDYTDTILDGITFPFLRTDDTRYFATGYNDIILSYVKNRNICYRLQRDRFLDEYIFTQLESDVPSRLYQCGMNINFAFQYQICYDFNNLPCDSIWRH